MQRRIPLCCILCSCACVFRAAEETSATHAMRLWGPVWMHTRVFSVLLPIFSRALTHTHSTQCYSLLSQCAFSRLFFLLCPAPPLLCYPTRMLFIHCLSLSSTHHAISAAAKQILLLSTHTIRICALSSFS